MKTNVDTHLKSWGLLKDERLEIKEDLNGNACSETLKFSLCNNVVLDMNNVNIFSGKEDCLDIVRGKNYRIKDGVFHCSGKQGITIKGSVDSVILENIVFRGNPKNGYVVLGQYCDYDVVHKPKTKNIIIKNCWFEKPSCGITLWNAEKIQFQGTSCKVNKVNPLIVKGYFLIRKIYDRLKYGKYGRCKSREILYKDC
jgi:hypothetical protein